MNRILPWIVLIGLIGCSSHRAIQKPTPQPTPAASPTPALAPVRPTPAPPAPHVAAPYDFEAIYFDFDRYTLRQDHGPVLLRHAEQLRARPALRLLVEGHCDERGTVDYNLALGIRRAEGAKVFLVATGIDPARLMTVTYGEERPLNPGHDELAWAQNRRAEFRAINGP